MNPQQPVVRSFQKAPDLIGLLWQLNDLGLGICLMLSALGFERVEYFVSLGYAASIAAQPVIMPQINIGFDGVA
jgi:hypothetical protein